MEPKTLVSPAYQADSFPLRHLGSPNTCINYVFSTLMIREQQYMARSESVKAENGVEDRKSNVLLATVVSVLSIQV